MAGDRITDLRILRMTAYPPGNGPYDRWELTVEATGELLLTGTQFPIDEQPTLNEIRAACDAYRAKLEAAYGKQS